MVDNEEDLKRDEQFEDNMDNEGCAISVVSLFVFFTLIVAAICVMGIMIAK